MDAVAIAGLVGLILVKEIGVPLPVPGDLVIIGAGAYLSSDPPLAGMALAAILLAGYVGASVQFYLLGTALWRPLLSALNRLGIGAARLQQLSDRFRSTGIRGVALTRMTPGVRIAWYRQRPLLRSRTWCSCPASSWATAFSSPSTSRLDSSLAHTPAS